MVTCHLGFLGLGIHYRKKFKHIIISLDIQGYNQKMNKRNVARGLGLHKSPVNLALEVAVNTNKASRSVSHSTVYTLMPPKINGLNYALMHRYKGL